jgi:hypothetical protein
MQKRLLNQLLTLCILPGCVQCLSCGCLISPLFNRLQYEWFSLAQAFTPGMKATKGDSFFHFRPLKGAEMKKGEGVFSVSPGVNAWARETLQAAKVLASPQPLIPSL